MRGEPLTAMPPVALTGGIARDDGQHFGRNVNTCDLFKPLGQLEGQNAPATTDVQGSCGEMAQEEIVIGPVLL